MDCLLCVRHSANCFIHFMVFTPQTSRRYLSSFTELEMDSDLQLALSHPAVQTEGYQILKVHGLLATPQGVCTNLLLSLE